MYKKQDSYPSYKILFVSLVLGVYFGILLIKSEVAIWQRVNNMFLFKELHMYLIIVTAIIVSYLSISLTKIFKINPKEVFKPKPFHKGVIFGGLIFGVGWAITGACPGPIYAQIGAGEVLPIFSFLGALVGLYLYALFYSV